MKTEGMKTIHFLGGTPRSGSTLMCNILAQNPRFHATHTSGCLDVLFGVRNQWDNLVEHKAHPNHETKDRVLKAIMSAYHQNVTKPIIFDKSRGWLGHLEMAEQILGKKAKVIVTVRCIPDILASMEKLHRETAKIKQPPGEADNYFLFQTVAGRCEYWCRPENLVGLAYARIVDAVKRGFRDRIQFVQFDELTKNPAKTLQKVYDFLQEEPFNHNFDHVEQVTHEDDELHGYVNLHTIKNKVEFQPSRAKEIIGQDLFDKYKAYNIDME